MRTDAGMLGLKNVNIFLPRPFSEALMSQTSASSVAADLQSAERSCSGYARGEPFVELPTTRVRYPCCRLQVRSTGSFSCSNFSEYASTTLQIASSLGSEWEKMNFKVCQEIQDLVFPEGVLWDKENRVPRTENMNPFFAQIGLVARSARGMDIKNKDSAEALSCLVAGGGLEPPTSGL